VRSPARLAGERLQRNVQFELFWHYGRFSGPRRGHARDREWSRAKPGVRFYGFCERQVTFNASRSPGCAFTVGSVGNYSIAFNSISPPSSGRLGHDGIPLFSASGPYDNWYSAAPLYFPTDSPHATATSSRTPTGSRTLTSSAEMTTPVDSPDSGGSVNLVVIIVPIAVVVLVLTGAIAFCLHRRRRRLADSSYQRISKRF
jgi:hypothetical protein